MRNLKKVLSLTLALVMMLGMMTFAGAAETTKKTAADLTDMNDVANKEAVTLLVDLTVVGGRDTGKFDPMGTLTRGEFAKLIYVAKMGSDDKATNFVGAATGLTDIKGKWFEGYVNYAFSTGIVSGRTKTVFDPDGKVKTAEAAKMLLVGLGYDAKSQGYTENALWSVNVMQQARQSGLLEGIKLGADAFMTRDAAAQMVFNALMAKTVSTTYGFDMNGKRYPTGSTENKTTWGEEVFDLQKVTGTVTGISNGKAIINGVVSSLNANPQVLGANAVYYKNSATGKLISSALVMGDSTVLHTSTNTAALANLTDISKKDYVVALDENAKYYVDGVSKKDTEAAAVVNGKAGVIVEFVDNNANGKADTVRVTVKKVATIGEKGVTIVKATAANKVDGIKIDGISALNGTVPAANVFGHEGLKEDDVVLYSVIDGRYYIEKAVSVTGSLTGKNADGYLMSGTAYNVSGLITGTAVTDVLEYNKDLTLYLDNNKSIVKLVLNEKAAAAQNAVILDMMYVANAGVGTTGGHTEALLLYTDGTTGTVKVGKIDGYTPTVVDTKLAVKSLADAATAYTYETSDTLATVEGKASSTKAVKDDATVLAEGAYYKLFTATGETTVAARYVGISEKNSGTAFENTIISYKESGTKDVYDLTTLVADTAAVAAKDYVTGSTTIGTGAVKVNNATVFLTKTMKDGAPVFAKYDGITKLPSMNAAGTAITKDTFATVVYLTTATLTEVAAKNIAYIVKGTDVGFTPKTSTTAEYYEYTAVVEGKITTVKADSATLFASKTGLWELKLVDGIAQTTGSKQIEDAAGATNGVNNLAAATGTVKAANGVIGLSKSSTAYYTYTSDAKVFFIDFTSRTVTEGKISDVVTHDTDVATAIVAKLGTGATATEKTTITTLYIEVKEGSDAGADGGSTSTAAGFTVSSVTAVATKTTVKIEATAKLTADGKNAFTITVVPYRMLADGSWLKLAEQSNKTTNANDKAEVKPTLDYVGGTAGSLYKFDVSLTYGTETITTTTGVVELTA